MESYRLKAELKLQAPLLTEAVGAMRFGLDSAMLKKEGLPVLRSTLIRGNVRHTLDEFADKTQGAENGLKHAQIERWFGQASELHGNFHPERAQLDFGYLFQLDEASKVLVEKEYRHRIKRDDDTGTVAPGALQIIESCFKTGAEVLFEGEIIGDFATEEDAQTAEYWLNKALHYLAAVGANKGTGFGRVLSASCTLLGAVKPETVAVPDTKRIGLCLTPDRPFCIARAHGRDSNRFVSEEVISGSVIKAVIARKLLGSNRTDRSTAQLELLERIGFDKWVVQHAFAGKKDKVQRGTALPLSLVYSVDQFFDVARQKTPGLIAGEIPAFSPDWKYSVFKKAQKRWSVETSNQRCLEVHTRITPVTSDVGGGQSEQGQLFSLECIDPKEDSWYADIDWSALNAQEVAEAQKICSQVLSTPLTGVGKTKARLTVEVKQQPFRDPQVEWRAILPSLGTGEVVLQLNTPACILPMDMYLVPLSNGQDALHKLYAEYWYKASGGVLELSHFYAQQHKMGGDFVHHYYLQQARNYMPFWLTNAGSVFVLKVNADQREQVETCLQRWLQRGIPPWHGHSTDWRENPWLNENGFGEVVINHPAFKELELTGGCDE